MRIAVFADRAPDDPEWKGAFVWNMVLALAEAQHEVLALTPLDPARIGVTHPRLTVAQPAKSFGVQHLPRWLQALFRFQPEVIHTFGLQGGGVRALTIWPMLESALSVLPRIRRFSTAFAPEDLVPFPLVETPVELPACAAVQTMESGGVLIPAPVSEWHRPVESLLLLNEFLLSNREVHIHILGGWGATPLSDRRAGWRMLEYVNQQIRMNDPVGFDAFLEEARSSAGLWLRSLKPTSWRAVAAAHVSRQFNLTTWGEVPVLNAGSPANFLSRLYSHGPVPN